MADEKKPSGEKPKDAPAPKRIPVLMPLPKSDGGVEMRFGTMPEDDLDKMPAGARVLTPKEAAAKEEEIAQEQADARMQERYEKVPTWRKVAGAVVGGMGGLNPDAPPTIQALTGGTFHGVTAGLGEGVVRQGIDALSGKEAGNDYEQRVEDASVAHPYAHGLGEVVGTIGSLELPGGAAENLAARGLARAGVKATTTLGRAGVAAAKLAVRGAAEGGISGGGEYVGDAFLHNQPLAADKFFTATGLGAMYGAGISAGLGGGASLLGSGYRSARSGLASILNRGEDAATKSAAANAVREVRLATETLDAGLHEHVATESPFDFGAGAEHRPVQLRPDVGQRGAVPVEEPFSISRRMTIDPDAGLHTSEARNFAERIAAGEPMQSPADLQFYQNNAKAIEAELHNLSNGGAANAIHPTGKGRYSTVTEHVPISDIDVPEPWDATKLPDLRAKRAAGIDLDPIRLGEMTPEQQAKTGKRFAINDGIHRTNVALERGEPSILAKYEVGEYPQKLNNDVFNAKRPIDVGPGGVRSSLGVTLDPEAGMAARGAGGRFQGALPTTDALKLSSARHVPREVLLREGIDAAAIDAAHGPIRIPAPDVPSSVQTGAAFRKRPTNARELANEFAFDALGATKTQARSALEHVGPSPEDAKRAVGEYVNRAILGPATEEATGLRGVYRAAANGRADDLLTAIKADKAGRIAAGISDAVKGTPARMSISDLHQRAHSMYTEMLRDPAKIAGAETFYRRVDLELSAINNAGKVAADGTIDAADAYYIRSALENQAYELGKASGTAGDAYKGFLRHWDAASVEALDKAAAKAGKAGGGDNIRYWKREWQLASAAEEAATGGAERVSHNNMFGIRESIAGGVGLATAAASDDPLTGVAGALGVMVGGKLLRERGAAMAARALTQIADRGALSRVVKRTSDQIARSAGGLVVPPASGPKAVAKARDAGVEILTTSRIRQLVTSTAARVAAFQNDPEAFIDHATHDVEPIAAHSPQIAEAIVSKRVQAMTFLASKLPVQGDPDPLDPHPKPRMTPGEERTFALYSYYADKPERFFTEVEHGRLIPEGAEVAKALVPGAFAELQDATTDRLTTMLARGVRLPYRQRQILGQLLEFAATPSQRPEHTRFLQDCASDNKPANDALPANSVSHGRRGGGGGGGIAAMPSPLDALEAGGIGRRRR